MRSLVLAGLICGSWCNWAISERWKPIRVRSGLGLFLLVVLDPEMSDVVCVFFHLAFVSDLFGSFLFFF